MKLGKVKDERGRANSVQPAAGEQRKQASRKAPARETERNAGKPKGAHLAGPAYEAQLAAQERLYGSMVFAIFSIWVIVMIVYGWVSGFFSRIC